MPSASHIIPIPIGNPFLCNWISNEMLNSHGHYVQAINYPTVAKGQERLRIAPSPLHSYEMIDEFIDDFVAVWNKSGLTTTTTSYEQQDMFSSKTCSQCQRTFDIDFDSMSCGAKTNCPLYVPC